MFHPAARWLVWALAGALAWGCGAKPRPAAPPSDLSAPRAAALSFLKAIARGDAGAAKNASLGTDQDKQWIDAMVGLINGLRSYDSALLARFGQAAVPTDVDLKQAVLTFTEEPIMRFQGAITKEAPDTAEVDAALNGMRLAAEPPIYLRKDKGVWKVDLVAMREDPRHDLKVVRQYQAAAKALQSAAAAIRAGRYKTFEAAQQALAQEGNG